MEGNLMEKIVSLAKRRGFVYPGSEIYGGLAGTWDYGPLGVALKKNIENLWWKHFVDSREDMYGIDSAVLMNPKVWEASGHVGGFSDPIVECSNCKNRFREDHLIADYLTKIPSEFVGQVTPEMRADIPCPSCGKKGTFGATRQFNMMFKTQAGAKEDASSTVYLRPETAQGMFVNFKNIIDSYHPKLPFGIAQIGKAFRNEIAPRDFIFRVRELEIMEFEYFVEEKTWQDQFEYWLKQTREWFALLGFEKGDVKEVEIEGSDLAHYSKRTVDFHFRYPHKFDEIGGLAYRTDFDLRKHMEHSGEDLRYLDPSSNEKFAPHVLEPTFGLGRHLMAVFVKAYTEDELGGEARTYLKLPPHLAPIKAAVFPLLKNKPELVAKAREVFVNLKREIPQVVWDDNGNIGKRYRRQDEVGTPFCVTIDFDTLGEEGGEKKDTVTIRHRDTGEQERISISLLTSYIKSRVL